MKSSVIAVASFAALALATPVDKRALVTSIEWEVVTVTVTGFPPEKTGAPAEFYEAPAETTGGPGWGRFGGWGGRGGNGGGDSAPAPTSAPAEEAPVEEAPVQEAPSFAPEAPSGGAPPSGGGAPPSSGGSGGAPPVNSPISSDYAQGILDSHNNHRANHSAPALVWSDRLASIAQQIGQKCVYAHDTSTGGGGYGQNIGAGAPPSDIPAMITNQMYNGEINLYPGYGREPDMSRFSAWGHFSQIVWKSTTEVGCATVHCPGGLANTGGGVSPYFTICNYGPPGNFGGQYAANVLAPLGAPTITL